jgi:hypothetical protein
MRRPLGLVAVLAAGISLAAPAALANPLRPAGPAGPAGRAGAGHGDFGIRLVDVPVSEAPDSRAWRYIIDFLHPGTVIRRRVAVENNTSSVAHVSVYADAAAIRGGQFTGDTGAVRSDLIRWTSVGRPVLTLAPWASAMDMVTIRVPRDAVAGERYGVVWAQETSHARGNGQRFAVTEVNRVGVRIYLDVGPGGPPPTRFAITSVSSGLTRRGVPEVIARVRDTGARAIDLYGSLRLSNGPGGSSAGPFRFTSGLTLAPGQSGQMTQVLSATTPAGSWHVTVTLQSGDTAQQAQATIQLGAMQAAGFITPRTTVLAAGAIVALLALTTWLFIRRLRIDRQRGQIVDRRAAVTLPGPSSCPTFGCHPIGRHDNAALDREC